ncbi:MAG: hypothetical protein II028_00015 [Clostridia bacterium]|jgi:hypothetical protein|nr:hypothetical protein [Clostridia bacterium]
MKFYNAKVDKTTRLLLAVAAALLGSILKKFTGLDAFFWLGIIACVLIFALLGRGEQYRERWGGKK